MLRAWCQVFKQQLPKKASWDKFPQMHRFYQDHKWSDCASYRASADPG